MAISTGARLTPSDWPSVNTAARTDFDDEPLVKAAQKGDRAAFGELYQRYVRMVHGILLARIPSTAVEDLVHDVFLSDVAAGCIAFRSLAGRNRAKSLNGLSPARKTNLIP